jgi:tetratricopeptide (TPR) repeat protein
MAIAAAMLTGCSGWLGRGSSGVASGTQTESYSQYTGDYQQRSLVAPGMGLDNNLEPSTTQKFTTAVVAAPAKVGNTVKDGYIKLTSWGSSDSTPTTDATSTTTFFGGLFAKKEEPSPELCVATARVYERSGNYTAAAAEYETALKETPDYVPALLSYGHLMDHQDKLADATKLYQRAVKSNPKEAATYNDLGLCFARRRMMADSLSALTTAVQLQPDRPLYRNNLAVVLVDQHRPDDAFTQLRAVNNEAVANYDLGVLLEHQKQDALAQAHFQRALELNPSFAEARQWSQYLAERAPAMASPPSISSQPAAPPGPRIASVPTSMQRPGFYGGPPKPVVAGPVPNPSSMPPTPDNLGNYQPSPSAELHALPPVQ